MPNGPLDNMPRYCPNCGAAQSDFDRECAECGGCGFSYEPMADAILGTQINAMAREAQALMCSEAVVDEMKRMADWIVKTRKPRHF